MEYTLSPRICAILILCASGITYATDKVTYLVADRAAEPYQISAGSGGQVVHSGILTDILFAALRDSDTTITSIVSPYKRIRLELLSQRHTNWINYGSPSWLDEKVLELGEYSEMPILESTYSLVSLVNPGIPTLADVRNKRVIVIHGYSYFPSFYHWATANEIELVFAPSPRHALAMLKQHRGDFYMAELHRVQWQARQSGIPLAKLHFMDFSSIIPPSVVYFLFDKRIPQVTRQRINQRLNDLKQNGELNRLINRYR